MAKTNGKNHRSSKKPEGRDGIKSNGNGHTNGNGNGNGNGRDMLLEDTMPTDHHIVPSSCMREKLYESYIGKTNITEVPKGKHNIFHRIFFNLTPPEIIAFLVKYFWGGQRHWVQMYLENPEYFDEAMEKRKTAQKNKNGNNGTQK